MKNIAPPPILEPRDLRLALAIAAAGTTARASALLHLSQPAVSRALLAVEEKLGTPLFARTARGLVPTRAGERLIAGAAPLLVALDELERRVRAPAPRPRSIRLVCECYTAYHWLPSAVVALRKSLPDLELALAVEHTRDPVAALARGEIDVALLTTAAVPRGALAERELFSDEIVFIVSAGHPLARRETITRADLQAHRLLTGSTPPAEMRWFVTKVFGRARPALRFERLPLTEAIVDVARAGQGIAILSEWIAAPHLAAGGLVAKRLASGPLYRRWRIAWQRALGEETPARLRAALAATAPRGRVIAGAVSG